MDDSRLLDIVGELGDNPCPVVLLTAMSDVVDEVDMSWRKRVNALLDGPGLDMEAHGRIIAAFPEALWVEGKPEDFVTDGNEPLPEMPVEDEE